MNGYPIMYENTQKNAINQIVFHNFQPHLAHRHIKIPNPHVTTFPSTYITVKIEHYTSTFYAKLSARKSMMCKLLKFFMYITLNDF